MEYDHYNNRWRLRNTIADGNSHSNTNGNSNRNTDGNSDRNSVANANVYTGN